MKLKELISILNDKELIVLQVNNLFEDGACTECFVTTLKDGVLVGALDDADFSKSDYEYYEDCDISCTGSDKVGDHPALWISVVNHEDGTVNVTDPHSHLDNNELREEWENRTHAREENAVSFEFDENGNVKNFDVEKLAKKLGLKKGDAEKLYEALRD